MIKNCHSCLFAQRKVKEIPCCYCAPDKAGNCSEWLAKRGVTTAPAPTQSVPGRKDDHGKPRWSLLPWGALRSVVDVLTQGAIRYQDHNWQLVQNARDRYFSACQRHLTAWWAGEADDPDDQLPHLAHAICCLLFLLWFDQQAKK